MKLTPILIFIAVLVFFKILFAVVFFLCSPIIFLTLVGLGVLIKGGIFAKLFHSRKPKNEEVVIEIEPID